MDTIRTSFPAVKQCRKTIWKSVKKYCIPSCIRRRTAKRCTKDKAFDVMTITVAENFTLHEKLSATKAHGDSETEQIPILNSSKTEEVKEPGTSDLEVQSKNVNEEVGKKKRKRGNRRRRNNGKSQDIIKEETVMAIVQDDETKSVDRFPNSPIEGTALAETVTNNVPSGEEHINNETAGCSTVQELDSEYKSDEYIHSRMKIKCDNKKRSKSDKSQNVIKEAVSEVINGDETKSVYPFPNSPIGGTALAETVTNNVPSGEEHINNETAGCSTVQELDSEYKSDEYIHSRMKIKCDNKKRSKSDKSQNVIKEAVSEVINGDETKSVYPFPNSPIGGTALAETVTDNVPSGDEHVNNETAGRSVVQELDNACQSGADFHSQRGTTSTETVSWRIKRVNNNVADHSGMRKFGNSHQSVADQHSQTQPRIIISKAGEGKTEKKVIHMYLSSNKNVKLDRTVNAWVPTIATRQAMTDADGTNTVVAVTNRKSNTTEEVSKNVQSILNKITPKNADELIERFTTLPINTIERMENAVDLVFKRAIQEQNIAPLYAALCSKMQYVKVTCAQSNTTTSFKLAILTKCQSLFKSDKSNQTSSMKIQEEINLCRDPEKKKELELEYRENERRLHKRSLGNCCFIGHLFNQHVVNLKIIQYCIGYLICQRSDDPIECLCNLLTICGKELEQLCNLDDTFNNVKALACVKSLSLRTRFMIQNTVELRRNKWLPRH